MPGVRVIVPFGKKKLYSAVVSRVHNQAPTAYETKDIVQVFDSSPVVNQTQLSFWNWMADYYMCTVGEVMKAALPSAMKLESETIISVVEQEEEAEAPLLSEKEDQLLLHIKAEKKSTIQSLAASSGISNPMPILQQLIEKNLIQIDEDIDPAYKPRFETFISMHSKCQNNDAVNIAFEVIAKAPARQKVLMSFLALAGPNKAFTAKIKKKELLTKANVSASALTALIDLQILSEEKVEVSRLDTSQTQTHDMPPLSNAQQVALEQINESFTSKPVVLLHGITSSGKTEVYLRLINDAIAQGKQVLYLLPEIAITTQIINRLKRIYGNRVGIYHSKFSDGQRVEVYQSLLNDKPKEGFPAYDIVLGVRSSLFLPFSRLGLIIVDEEHESSFKQYTPAPRYHARDAAILLASMHGAKVLLGSATPSIDTYYNTQTGKYGLVELNERFRGIQLPEIEVVNIKDARKRKKMHSHFSARLLELIGSTLERKEQVILFQNRRGFAPFIECDECAWVPHCEYCDVSLTYHKHSNQLVCHYCGYALTPTKTCLACGSPSLRTKGFGTEKIEDDLTIFFPEARIARMDLDSTRSRFSYERIVDDFEHGKIDILVGTQMVTKGFDFDRVSLVGILNADNMLNFPDFRAHERAFQLMAQVSGRAGRKGERGKVLLQTSQPEHEVIEQIVATDYLSMYNQQLSDRKMFRYPPLYRLISITLKHRKREDVHEAANLLASMLRNKLGNRVLGPEEPAVSKVQNFYIRNLMIKIERDRSVVKAKEIINEQIMLIRQYPHLKSLVVAADVDPA